MKTTIFEAFSTAYETFLTFFNRGLSALIEDFSDLTIPQVVAFIAVLIVGAFYTEFIMSYYTSRREYRILLRKEQKCLEILRTPYSKQQFEFHLNELNKVREQIALFEKPYSEESYKDSFDSPDTFEDDTSHLEFLKEDDCPNRAIDDYTSFEEAVNHSERDSLGLGNTLDPKSKSRPK